MLVFSLFTFINDLNVATAERKATTPSDGHVQLQTLDTVGGIIDGAL